MRESVCVGGVGGVVAGSARARGTVRGSAAGAPGADPFVRAWRDVAVRRDKCRAPVEFQCVLTWQKKVSPLGFEPRLCV